MADIILGNLKFYWAGEWSASTVYDKDDVVKYGASVYVCTEAHTSGSVYSENSNLFELMVEGITSRGEYNNTALYQINDLVTYGGSVYIAIQETQDNIPTDTNNWKDLVAGFQWENVYNAGTTYQKNDIVRYGGFLYIAKTTTTGNAPTDTDFFDLLTEGFRIAGVYDENTTYLPGDIIRFGGNSYYAKLETTGNTPPDEQYYGDFSSGFKYAGEFTYGTFYRIGEVVKYGGGTYLALSNNLNSYPFDTNNWDRLTGGIKFKGNWVASTDYAVDDVVTVGGVVYICIQDFVFDGSTQENPSPNTTVGEGEESAYWQVYTEGFRWLDNWDILSDYVKGDVVKYGGDTYVALAEHGASQTNIPGTVGGDAFWNVFTEGMSWQGVYDAGTTYRKHEVVEYATSSYISLVSENTGNTPTDSPAAWALVAQGDTNQVMTNTGDIAVRGNVAVERLGIGPQGSYLYSDGTNVLWGSASPTNTFYVALTGDDTNDGKTPATAFRTLRKALDETYNYGQCSISMYAGVYEEQCPMKVGKGVVIEGQGLGAVTISPNNSRDDGFGLGISDDGSTPNANSQVFQMNNAARLRNVVFRGFSTGSVMVALDPGNGPDDTSVWITSQSPYVQNCTAFTPEGTGMLIDGSLHNGGYKSMVANDWTQINSDGVGIHVTNDARCELVSVFTYYCNPGYFAESGGKIRSVNGSSAYGEVGVKAIGFSQNETPLDARLQLTDDVINSVQTIGSAYHTTNLFKDQFGNLFLPGYTDPTANDITGSFDATASYPVISKFNSDGSFDWVYTYEGDFGALHSCIEVDQFIYAAGIINIGGTNRGFLLKISRNGELQWQKTLGDTDEIVDLVTDDVYIYFVGDHATQGTSIAKLSSGGIIQWTRTLDYSAGSINTLRATSVTFANEPTTSTDSYANEGVADAATDLYIATRDDTNGAGIIVRYNEDGGLEAAYDLGDVYINDIELDTGNGDGIYIGVAGYYINGATKNPLLLRLSVGGDVIWQNHFNFEGEFKSILPFGEDVYASGYRVDGVSELGLVARFNSAGAKQWLYSLSSTTGSISLNGVTLDGVNVIAAGVNGGDTVLVNVQRNEQFGIGSVTTGGFTWTSMADAAVTTTVAEKTDHTAYSQNLSLGVSDTGLIINQGPGLSRSVAATRSGFAGIGSGINFSVTNLARQPKEGSVVHIEGDDQTYFCIGVSNYVPDAGVTEDNYPNVYDQMVNNRDYFVNETVGYVNSQVANATPGSIWYNFVYDETKCQRDLGLVLDALETDVDSDQNSRSIDAGLAYFSGAYDAFYDDDERAVSIAALGYLKVLLVDAINRQFAIQESYAPDTPYDNAQTPEAGGITLATNNIDIVIDIVTNGVDAAPSRIATGYASIALDPPITSNKTPDDDTAIVFREAFSQVRMTGHDFLDIGTGGFADTNYPVIIQADYIQTPSQERETQSEDGGRVFYVTTDQDGNFRVGDYFKVEQATGRATLSSEEFDLSGLNELQLGSIRAGKQGATVNEFSTDGTMADNSDTSVPTERAVVTYVTDKLASGEAQAYVIRSLDQATKIQVQETTGENVIRFDTDNTERLTIGATGQITAASGYTPSANLDLTTKEYVDAKGDIKEGDSQLTVTDTGNDGSANFIIDGSVRATVTAGGIALENGARVDEFSTDTTLAGNSDTAVPTEAAVKSYIDTALGGFSQNSIQENNSNVTVVDSGTGVVTVNIDGTDAFSVDGSDTSIKALNGYGFVGDLTGNVSGDGGGNISGNAATATALETARNFSITGAVTAANVSFDGTGNVTLNTVVTHNHDSDYVSLTGDTMSGTLTVTGNVNPTSNNSYDLGTNTERWRNIYTNDLNLSNEGMEGGNDVDGTTGSWTIQEGEEELYLLNRKNGKKYKFLLQEIK